MDALVKQGIYREGTPLCKSHFAQSLSGRHAVQSEMNGYSRPFPCGHCIDHGTGHVHQISSSKDGLIVTFHGIWINIEASTRS
jgi:hypothetical protein